MNQDGQFTGDGVVLRVGELFLKGRNRHLFEDALERNVRRALEGREGLSVTRAHGRFFVLGASDEDLLDRLRWVFGITSFSPARFCEKTMDAINAVAVELALEYPARDGDTFRIAARRSDKSFERNSAQIGRETGSEVAVATGMGVDLEQPDLRVGVEVGKAHTFVWTDQLPGGGGLPVGTSGKIMLLLSGGLDSPVAGHLLQKRGLELTAVYFHAFPYTGDGARDKVVDLAKVLAGRQKKFTLHVVQFAKIQELMRDEVDGSYLVLMYRRAMIRIAERLAAKDKISALASGESLGQVASQTLANLGVVEDAAGLTIIRPLITFDKIETIDIARRIGTYDISIRPHDDCCTLFVPRHPQTKGLVRKARMFERDMEWEALVGEAVESAESMVL